MMLNDGKAEEKAIAVSAPQPEQAVTVHLDLDESQYLLFGDGAELLTVDADEKSGKYSGKIIEKNRARVRAIVQSLAMGVGQLKVAKAFGVSVHTVRGIIQRNPELIAIEEKKLSGQLGHAFTVGLEQYTEAIIRGDIPPQLLPVGLGILFDKKQLIDGKPTSISGSVKPGATIEDMKRALAELPVIELESCSTADAGPQSETQSGGNDAK